MMIEWMQKHKKWLVITIWISAIAFIGAGGFAWGVYDYSLAGNTAATVGKLSISKAEFTRAYQREFEERNRQLGGTLDEIKAKEMGLDAYVLNTLISNALLRNYALDIGLRISDADIATEISTNKYYEIFHTNGVFDLQKYNTFIINNGLSKQAFEQEVGQKLLEQKILALLLPQLFTQKPIPTTTLEHDAMTFALRLQDTINLHVIQGANIAINPTQSALKAFWEEHKNTYLTPARYTVQIAQIHARTQPYTQEELQQFYEKNYITQSQKDIPESIKPQVILALQQEKARLAALKEYSKLQKNDFSTSTQRIIAQDSNEYSAEILQALESSAPLATLKPMPLNDDVITLKVLEKHAPQPKSFDDVKALIQAAYIAHEREKKLEELAKQQLPTFIGKTTIARMPTEAEIATQNYSLGGLDFANSMELLNKIFESPRSADYAIIGQNAYLFRIASQSLSPAKDLSMDSSANMIATQIKTQLLIELVFDFLEQRYQVKKFI